MGTGTACAQRPATEVPTANITHGGEIFDIIDGAARSRLSSNQTGKFTIGQHGLPTWDILAPTPASGVRRTGE